MTQTTPSADQHQFVRASPWKRVFRIIRWTTYTFALVTLVLLLHKAPPPLVETSPQAAARAEGKFEQVEKAVASGQTRDAAHGRNGVEFLPRVPLGTGGQRRAESGPYRRRARCSQRRGSDAPGSRADAFRTCGT